MFPNCFLNDIYVYTAFPLICGNFQMSLATVMCNFLFTDNATKKLPLRHCTATGLSDRKLREGMQLSTKL